MHWSRADRERKVEFVGHRLPPLQPMWGFATCPGRATLERGGRWVTQRINAHTESMLTLLPISNLHRTQARCRYRARSVNGIRAA